MSQFSDRIYFGYLASIRPSNNDPIRRKLIIPKWNLSVLPYFCGADLIYKLKIEPTKSAIPCSTIKYEWYLYKKDVKKPCDFDSGILDMSLDEVEKPLINLGHFSFTAEYKLDLALTIGDESDCQTVLDFEITSRANMQMAFIWSVLASIVAIVAGVIGALFW